VLVLLDLLSQTSEVVINGRSVGFLGHGLFETMSKKRKIGQKSVYRGSHTLEEILCLLCALSDVVNVLGRRPATKHGGERRRAHDGLRSC